MSTMLGVPRHGFGTTSNLVTDCDLSMSLILYEVSDSFSVKQG